MATAGDAAQVGRSLLVGVVLDQVRTRSRLILALGGLVGILAMVGAVLTGGAMRVLFLLIVGFAVLGCALVLALRSVAVRVLRRIAPPVDVTGHREAVQEAVDQLALPTGPISGLRVAWRLRDGIDDEVANAEEVIAVLRARLDPSA